MFTIVYFKIESSDYARKEYNLPHSHGSVPYGSINGNRQYPRNQDRHIRGRMFLVYGTTL